MKNPWLEIPAEDYKGRMASPEVAQLPILNGLFIAALQSASRKSPPVTATPYTNLEALAPIMKLADIDTFSRLCSHNELVQTRTQNIPMKHGKALFVGYYRKSNEAFTATDVG